MNYIYLDHAASAPLRPEVREAMEPFLGERYGNPSSSHHWGRQARHALEEARERVAAALRARPREILFTSGGTEADNLAVLGSWRAARSRGRPAGPVVISAVEHAAVKEAARQAAAEGAEVLVLGVDGQGRVSPDAAVEALSAGPSLVSVMWGNNEVGTVQPVGEIGLACRERGVTFHTDAVQAFGKVPADVRACPCDLLSISAHKLGGPMGTGALYVREGTELAPLALGGGQEHGLRSGTESVAAAVGLARAAELAAAEAEAEALRLGGLRDRLESGIRAALPDAHVYAGEASRLPHISSLGVPGVSADALLIGLDLAGVAASGGSACHSGSIASSPVLAAMGQARLGYAMVRFSLGRTTVPAEIDALLARFPDVVRGLRAQASPSA